MKEGWYCHFEASRAEISLCEDENFGGAAMYYIASIATAFEMT